MQTLTTGPARRRWQRVLVADDSPTIQKMTRHLLEQAGLEVVVVSNGASAVEAVQQQRFDLILMDLEMPEMGGLEATRSIRQTWSSQALPIIGVSATTEPLMRDICKSAGMTGLLAKPLRLDVMRTILDERVHEALPITA